MSEIILKVENLSKQYRLGTVGTGSVKDDLKRWWYQLKGKDDPFLKIGDFNDRTKESNSNYVWALKDISFEVEKGEVIGIIGKNGAGKSTLLKILSRITTPTKGCVKFNGRIASLLEVGTGFHPELTGKENVYLNGAILGMTKSEIDNKFNDIVSFSGCERYIDTPVKRYSSGMTVRLAFAVAAFLEPDILIIDEVLAVGDAEFQDRAIGKMKEISKGGGRTVLFVSHNMESIMSLCQRCILLENGNVKNIGGVDEIIQNYLLIKETANSYSSDKDIDLYLSKASIEYLSSEVIYFKCVIQSKHNTKSSIDLRFKTKSGVPIGYASYGAFNDSEMLNIKEGENIFNFKFNAKNWALGKYFLSVDLTLPDVKYYERLDNIIMFEIIRNSGDDRRSLNIDWNYGAMQIELTKESNDVEF